MEVIEKYALEGVGSFCTPPPPLLLPIQNMVKMYNVEHVNDRLM